MVVLLLAGESAHNCVRAGCVFASAMYRVPLQQCILGLPQCAQPLQVVAWLVTKLRAYEGPYVAGFRQGVQVRSRDRADVEVPQDLAGFIISTDSVSHLHSLNQPAACWLCLVITWEALQMGLP